MSERPEEDSGHLGPRLHDWLDGELDAAAHEAATRHLAACPQCRREAAELQELRACAAALPAERTPAHDLWPAIAARLGAQETAATAERPAAGPDPAAAERGAPATAPPPADGSGRRTAAPRRGVHPVWAWSGWLAAAAALTLALLRPAAPDPARLAAGSAAQEAAEPGALVAMAGLELDSQRAQAEYLASLRESAAEFAPETRAVIEHNLKVIDEAIAQTRAALDADPRNPRLARRLASGYRERIALLQQALRLPARI